MLAVFKRGARPPREILDLTAPADDGDGIVGRWRRETTSRVDADSDAVRHEPSAEEPTG